MFRPVSQHDPQHATLARGVSCDSPDVGGERRRFVRDEHGGDGCVADRLSRGERPTVDSVIGAASLADRNQAAGGEAQVAEVVDLRRLAVAVARRKPGVGPAEVAEILEMPIEVVERQFRMDHLVRNAENHVAKKETGALAASLRTTRAAAGKSRRVAAPIAAPLESAPPARRPPSAHVPPPIPVRPHIPVSGIRVDGRELARFSGFGERPHAENVDRFGEQRMVIDDTRSGLPPHPTIVAHTPPTPVHNAKGSGVASLRSRSGDAYTGAAATTSGSQLITRPSLMTPEELAYDDRLQVALPQYVNDRARPNLQSRLAPPHGERQALVSVPVLGGARRTLTSIDENTAAEITAFERLERETIERLEHARRGMERIVRSGETTALQPLRPQLVVQSGQRSASKDVRDMLSAESPSISKSAKHMPSQAPHVRISVSTASPSRVPVAALQLLFDRAALDTERAEPFAQRTPSLESSGPQTAGADRMRALLDVASMERRQPFARTVARTVNPPEVRRVITDDRERAAPRAACSERPFFGAVSAKRKAPLSRPGEDDVRTVRPRVALPDHANDRARPDLRTRLAPPQSEPQARGTAAALGDVRQTLTTIDENTAAEIPSCEPFEKHPIRPQLAEPRSRAHQQRTDQPTAPGFTQSQVVTPLPASGALRDSFAQKNLGSHGPQLPDRGRRRQSSSLSEKECKVLTDIILKHPGYREARLRKVSGFTGIQVHDFLRRNGWLKAQQRKQFALSRRPPASQITSMLAIPLRENVSPFTWTDFEYFPVRSDSDEA